MCNNESPHLSCECSHSHKALNIDKVHMQPVCFIWNATPNVCHELWQVLTHRDYIDIFHRLSCVTDHYLRLFIKKKTSSFKVTGAAVKPEMNKDSPTLTVWTFSAMLMMKNPKDAAIVNPGQTVSRSLSLCLLLCLPMFPGCKVTREVAGLRSYCTPITWEALGLRYSPLCYVGQLNSFRWSLVPHFIVDACRHCRRCFFLFFFFYFFFLKLAFKLCVLIRMPVSRVSLRTTSQQKWS